MDYALLVLVKENDGIYISFNYCREADKGSPIKEIQGLKMYGEDMYMQIRVNKGGECHFNFSLDGKVFDLWQSREDWREQNWGSFAQVQARPMIRAMPISIGIEKLM